MGLKAIRLTAAQVRRKTDPRVLRCATTRDLKQLDSFIGQPRAEKAVDFGLSVPGAGYNVFIVGPRGSGRTSYALASVRERAARQKAPDDWIYVNNFDDPAAPLAISLPAGQARAAESAFANLVEELKNAIAAAFEKSSYEDAKSREIGAFQDEIARMMDAVRAEAEKENFLVKRTPQGFVNIPLKTVSADDGKEEKKELQTEEFDALPAEEQKHLKSVSDAITLKTLDALRQIREKERVLKDKISEMDAKICRKAIKPCIDRVREKFGTSAKMAAWIDAFENNVVNNFSGFLAAARDENAEFDFTPYRIGVLVSNDPAHGAPVVWETNPTYYNLAGKMEYESRQGYYFTDFTHITGGALHRANGGYLVLDAEELLRSFMSYDLVKRVLRTGCLPVENLSDQLSAMPAAAPRPEPVPINVKLVLIGGYDVYDLLKEHDGEFAKFFKTVAEFDTEMPRTPDNEREMARFIKTAAERENCLPFTKGALAELIEHAARMAGDQEQLSTQFNALREYVVEASVWARRAGAKSVDRAHVLEAIREKRFRTGMVEEKLRRDFAEGILRIDTEGAVVGQINGLAVAGFDGEPFGHPTRITANTFMGQEGVVNIERETSMAGPIHNKGLLTLVSYLGRVYAQEMPLSLSARVAFEQNYGGIDGDSASSTELYCLLSSLSGVPIKQNIAVTGSVDQFGNIQPIGGVNEKIEGFFAYCRERGLTGDQGVMIPYQNAKHLMLSHEVTEAVRRNKFHVWTVKDIDEGIELLTGAEAGTRGEDGTYPENSIHGRAMKKLKQWVEMSTELTREKNESPRKETGA